ncbi:hypothetical protein HanPI659440_Chr17g0665621 [Helianthus annuus]|nr:hypothetical protein HanPI659440_Chr17g0665621 [Helianthus annuus]
MYPNCADQKRNSQPVDYADNDLWTVSRREITSVRPLCDSSYMPSLSVFRKNKPCLGVDLMSFLSGLRKLSNILEGSMVG